MPKNESAPAERKVRRSTGKWLRTYGILMDDVLTHANLCTWLLLFGNRLTSRLRFAWLCAFGGCTAFRLARFSQSAVEFVLGLFVLRDCFHCISLARLHDLVRRRTHGIFLGLNDLHSLVDPPFIIVPQLHAVYACSGQRAIEDAHHDTDCVERVGKLNGNHPKKQASPGIGTASMIAVCCLSASDPLTRCKPRNSA